MPINLDLLAKAIFTSLRKAGLAKGNLQHYRRRVNDRSYRYKAKRNVAVRRLYDELIEKKVRD